MTSLRLLMTVDAVGGVWTYACELGQALAARGVRTAFAVLGPPPSDEQRARVRAIPGARLFEHPGRLEWMDDPWGDVRRSGDWLLELGRRTAPDLVHLNG